MLGPDIGPDHVAQLVAYVGSVAVLGITGVVWFVTDTEYRGVRRRVRDRCPKCNRREPR